MSKKLNNNELKHIGFRHEDLLAQTGYICKNLIKEGIFEKETLLNLLGQLLENPEHFAEHPQLNSIAQLAMQLQPRPKVLQAPTEHFELRNQITAFNTYGKDYIDQQAIEQMNVAMRLPVSIAGALMPDAHVGYGLPIGGVLATPPNVVIPYAVGVDIACRMCLSVFDIEAHVVESKSLMLKNYLLDNTVFGIDGRFAKPLPCEVFDRPEWNATEVIRKLRHKAQLQIGTSGTGNHFVEWGILEVMQPDSALRLPTGKYLALLSHSGSRGFGAAIANHYSKIATERTKLPKEARHLAWLNLDTAEGQEYWIAMNLAGHYAAANHHQIHQRMAKALGTKPLLMVENHHNFAWLEQLPDGSDVMVHRKGATPAHANQLGIIPATMTQAGFVVRGKGNPQALNSASHGAGRLMARGQALRSITKAEWKKVLKEKNVTLIGADLDEAPMVYKDLNKVMEFQEDLVEVLAKFQPKIVRMADPDKRNRRED